MPKVKEQSLILLPQVTMGDLLAEVEQRNLDVADLLRVAEPELPYIPDVPSDPVTRLVRALLELPLPDDEPIESWFQAYRGAGEDWCWLVAKLRIRNCEEASVVADPRVVDPGAYRVRVEDDGTKRAQRWPLMGRSSRSELLRPHARTLGLELRRSPAGKDALKVPARKATDIRDLDALTDAVVERVRPTVGGDAFLRPNPRAHALAVLAATVTAVLQHRSSQLRVGDERFVRFDRFRSIFEALELAPFFDVARRFLEADHPAHVPVQGPWPPGVSNELRPLAVLRGPDRLRLVPKAQLVEVSEIDAPHPEEEKKEVGMGNLASSPSNPGLIPSEGWAKITG